MATQSLSCYDDGHAQGTVGVAVWSCLCRSPDRMKITPPTIRNRGATVVRKALRHAEVQYLRGVMSMERQLAVAKVSAEVKAKEWVAKEVRAWAWAGARARALAGARARALAGATARDWARAIEGVRLGVRQAGRPRRGMSRRRRCRGSGPANDSLDRNGVSTLTKRGSCADLMPGTGKPYAAGCPSPCVTFRLVVAPLRGPGRSPVLPFACCVGSLLSVGRCGRCSCWRRFRVRGAQ